MSSLVPFYRVPCPSRPCFSLAAGAILWFAARHASHLRTGSRPLLPNRRPKGRDDAGQIRPMNSEQLHLADDGMHQITTPVTRCYLGKVYYVGRFNNSRVGPSRLIVKDELGPLFCTRRAVDEYIQPQRTKGTTWERYDVPVVVIDARGVHRLILTSDQRAVNPLSSFSPTFPEGVTLGELSRALMSQIPKDVYAMGSSCELDPADFPFLRYQSNSKARQRWDPKWYSFTLDGMMKMVTNVSLWLQKAGQKKIP
jgi:hypothetical protein